MAFTTDAWAHFYEALFSVIVIGEFDAWLLLLMLDPLTSLFKLLSSQASSLLQWMSTASGY
jgi:hypothetical protein